ncbi:MAG: SpoIIE family protein phosphatase [Planctomycetes bacterium]|nr:SpoIIE family protein phosphatase [Planctomycetota bacterium]
MKRFLSLFRAAQPPAPPPRPVAGFDPCKTVADAAPPREQPKPKPYLALVRGLAGHDLVALTDAPLVLGRDATLDVHLADAGISRRHCRVRRSGARVLVEDLGSTNGTFVDGERVEGEVELPTGATLQLGDRRLRLERLTDEDVAARRSFAADLDRARRYVEALIPPPLDAGPVRTEWVYVPSSVLGGDALGHHALSDGRLALYVVDVCGHGVEPALHAASVLNAIRGESLPETDFGDPGQVLARLNTAFAMETHNDLVFTIWYGVLDAERGRVRFASAGHPPALALSADGSTLRRLGTKNPPIGSFPARAFAQDEADLGRGERLYVFSDGAYELEDRDGRERSLEDFERVLTAPHADRSPGEPQRLYEASLAATGASLLEDDFSLLLATLPA